MMTEDEHRSFLRSRPPREGLRGLVEHLEPGSSIAGVHRLKGGLDASTHRVELVTRAGGRTRIVVRRFDASAQWFDPATVEREKETLDSLVATAVPAPEVLALDMAGAWLGVPTMVVTCLEGRPAPAPRWVEWSPRLVEAMALVHEVEPVVEGPPGLNPWLTGVPPRSIADDLWFERTWPLIIESRDQLAASGGDALVHNDLHPGNTLWSRRRVSGIVDWGAAGRGYPAYDRAYLRLDVSICIGLDAGDGFAAAAHALGQPLDHPAWDLVVALRALPTPDLWVSSYQEMGAPVTVEQGRARLHAWMERAIAQLR